ncbi:MAG TPA: hypothetical protein VLJ79_22430, partial [Candidatus Binatia bacterium]|nr:hypothetical protein [Candidatus Binatia bacterium]
PLAVGAYGGQIPDLFQRLKERFLYKSFPERYKVGNHRSFEIDKHTILNGCDQLDFFPGDDPLNLLKLFS